MRTDRVFSRTPSADHATFRRVARGATLAVALSLAAASAQATVFFQTNLVSDGFVPAANIDPDLINPWGVSFNATSPFWVSDNGAGVTTLYNGLGRPKTLFAGTPAAETNVIIATPTGQTPGTAAPTGQVFNLAPGGFKVSSGGVSGSSTFIFATEDGTISGWAPSVDKAHSILAVDNSGGGTGAVYKSLTIAANSGNPLLYAANFRAGTVEVYDQNFHLVNTITDPTVPAGYAPFNAQVLNNKLYVTFALQDAAKHDDVAGPGNGFVDSFNLDGSGMQRLVSNGVLNSPWGLDIAPAKFGQFANDLLVGNFGDGTINVFDPNTGTFLGTLDGVGGQPLVDGDLWAIVNGNNGFGSNPNDIYLTAGIVDEAHGLFASVAAPEPASLAMLLTGIGMFGWLRRRSG